MHPLSKAILRCVLAFTAVALVLGAFEIGLRVIGYAPISKATRGRSTFIRSSLLPDVPYELTPGVSGRVWGADVAINSQGFRGPDFPKEKPPGTKRIAVLGDSIAFGNQLAVESTFASRLDDLFDQREADVEVLNLGIGGYDVLDSLSLFVARGVQYSPDIVVLTYCINDVGVKSPNLAFVPLLERYGSWIQRVRLLQFVVFQLQGARIAVPTQRKLDSAVQDRRRAAGQIAAIGTDPALVGRMRELEHELEGWVSRSDEGYLSWYTEPERVGQLRHAFEWLTRLAERHDFQAVVVIVPLLTMEGRPGAFRSTYELIADEARRAGLPVVELSQPFDEIGLEALRLPKKKLDILHPNEVGHEVIAKELWKILNES